MLCYDMKLKGRTAIVREKLSFYRLFCYRSSAEKRLHFFLKDFCDIILCRYSLSLRHEMYISKAAACHPTQTIHFFNLVRWRNLTLRLYCEPHTISFLMFGKWKKVFRALIAKEKIFPFICCKFTIFASEYQASFLLVVAQKSDCFFRLKGFHPFLDIYLHTVAADPGRPLIFSCLLIFL